MDKEQKGNQGTMKIVRFEAGVLQTGTESSSAKEDGVTVTLEDKSNSGQHDSKTL